MSNANIKATNATNAKRTAPAPTVSVGTAPTKAAQGSAAAQAAAPQPTLYRLGPWPAGQRGHRAFAQAVAAQLTKAQPKGFTLAQYKAALVQAAQASTATPPAGGWQGHNMPTWAANPKQGWLTPVS